MVFNKLNDHSNKELKEEFKNIHVGDLNEQSKNDYKPLDKSNKD